MEKSPLLRRVNEIKKEGRPDYESMIADFLKDPRMSQSSMKKFLISPWDFIQYKEERKYDDAPHYDKGNVFELLLLEPEKADETIVEMPLYAGAGCVAKRKEFREANPGKVCVTGELIDEGFAMFKSAINHDDVLELLERKAAAQEVIDWTDPETKIRNRSILDFRSDWYEPQPFICDVKTATSAERQQFQKAIFNFDYVLQAGAYCAAAHFKKFVYPEYYWLVIENKEPYGINRFRCDPNLVAEGKRIYLEGLKAFKYCKEHNLWHESHSFWRFLSPYEIVAKPAWFRSKI